MASTSAPVCTFARAAFRGQAVKAVAVRAARKEISTICRAAVSVRCGEAPILAASLLPVPRGVQPHIMLLGASACHRSVASGQCIWPGPHDAPDQPPLSLCAGPPGGLPRPRLHRHRSVRPGVHGDQAERLPREWRAAAATCRQRPERRALSAPDVAMHSLNRWCASPLLQGKYVVLFFYPLDFT